MSAHELEGRAQGLVGGAEAAHDLHERDLGDGLQEMQADDAVGAPGPRRDLGDGQGRRVRGEDVLGGADPVQLLEDRDLQGQVLGDALHDQAARPRGRPWHPPS